MNFVYRDGSEGGNYQLLESVGGGVFSLDYDNDGWQDLYFNGGGSLKRNGSQLEVNGWRGELFRNTRGSHFGGTATAANITDDSLYTHGGTVSDFDSDGLVAGFGGLRAYRNLGDGTFEEVCQQLNIRSDSWNVTAAASDFNKDGLSDIYVVTYANWKPDPTRECLNDQRIRDVCGPTMFEGSRDILFRNNGSGFSDVTDAFGMVSRNRGLGVVTVDADANGFSDFFVVNDVEENQLYLNIDGTEKFVEDGALQGVAYSNSGEREGSMGVDACDFNRDGLVDLWYTNYTQQDNSLLKNVARSGFVHSADFSGLGGVSRTWVGFGTGFADFNCDGWDDIFVINGHVAYDRRDSPYFQPAQLFRSNRDGTFEDVTESGGAYFDHRRSGRGATVVDVDNDGALDLVVVHQNDHVALLLNTSKPAHSLKLRLIGTKSARDSVAAVTTIETDTEEVRRVWSRGGGGYLSHFDSRLNFNFDAPVVATAVVKWPSGRHESFGGLKGNFHTLVEGRGVEHASE